MEKTQETSQQKQQKANEEIVRIRRERAWRMPQSEYAQRSEED